mgnify:CR=1 FL=1
MSAQFAHFKEELQNTFIDRLTDLTNKNKSLNERIYNVLSEEGELPILYYLNSQHQHSLAKLSNKYNETTEREKLKLTL